MSLNRDRIIILFLFGILSVTWACDNHTYPDRNKVQLLFPKQDEVMDNGCDVVVNNIEWRFTWETVPGATSYHIYVAHEGANNPVTDDQTSDNFWNNSQEGFISPGNGTNWKWRVRAYKNGKWYEWSAERTFSVEPVNTDC